MPHSHGLPADDDFTLLLERGAVRDAAPTAAQPDELPQEALGMLARLLRQHPDLAAYGLRLQIEALVARIDQAVAGVLDAILHHPEFQVLEASWRGLHMLVRASDKELGCRVKFLDITKRELGRTLRKFQGNAWDQSPVFRRIYEEEYGQFGGEPYGLLVGDYQFDHQPPDVAMLSSMAQVAAAAHSPFVAAAAPTLLGMDHWDEVANPRDLTRIFTTPEYAAWRSLRAEQDARYVGLCMPRYLARLPYGADTDPLDAFHFEEGTDGPDTRKLLWGNPAFAFASNVARAFCLYGWCVRIRGIDRGGTVEGLPVLHHPTRDGHVDRKTVTEICLSERREAELSSCGLIPLVHRKNCDVAAFISAQSLQKPQEYEDPAATANAALSARLPYLFASCRFAHYLKCMVRDKVGSSFGKVELSTWLTNWIERYVDGSPESSSEEFKAAHPLEDAQVTLEDRADAPGEYEAKFYIKPHYQLEGLSVALRLVSQVQAAA